MVFCLTLEGRSDMSPPEGGPGAILDIERGGY